MNVKTWLVLGIGLFFAYEAFAKYGAVRRVIDDEPEPDDKPEGDS